MSKLLLVDGHSILNRAFYGLPDLTNSAGEHTGAVYGFITILNRILESENPDYLVVAFDVKTPTFRHEMFKEYKGTRHAMPDELREQVPRIQELLKAMGITIATLPGFEADDILGTLSVRGEKNGMSVTVLSGDRDLLQLATDVVKIVIPKTKAGGTVIEEYFAKDVLETLGLTPKQFIEYKALNGDTADNIPGVPGIGEKTATALISQYGSLEECIRNAADIKPPRASKNLIEFEEQARLSLALATINVDSPVEIDLEQTKLKNIYTLEAYELFRRYQFKGLLNKFDASNEKSAVALDSSVEIKIPTEYKSLGELNEDVLSGEIGIALKLSDGLIPPALAIATEGEIYSGSGYEVLDLLKGALLKAKLIAGFNLKTTMHRIDIKSSEDIGEFFDAEVAAYVLNPIANSYTADDVSLAYLGFNIEESIENEAWVAIAAKANMLKALDETKQTYIFKEIELPLVRTLYDMEREGIAMDATALRSFGDSLKGRIEELTESIYKEAGEEFNINSPKQLGVILFEKMGLPCSKKTKTGYSTSVEVLEELAVDYPIVNSILEYRQLTKLMSTYVEGLANAVSEDKRIHSTFQQTVTATGRISSTEPNLQNIPIRLELGRQIRKVFLPKEDCVFLDADYSQIELRVIAHLSGDENLIEAFKAGQDIHTSTAARVFKVAYDEVTPLMRRRAKAVNFGIVYGISAFGLARDIGVSQKEAKEYIASYFESYPKLKAYLDDSVAQAKECGYAVTMWGRRRPIPELKNSNFMQRSFGERVAMNSPVQGTAADIIKVAMVKVHDRLLKEGLRSKLLLQVHDELLIETYREEQSKVEAILTEEMTGAAALSVALLTDMHAGNSWYEAK